MGPFSTGPSNRAVPTFRHSLTEHVKEDILCICLYSVPVDVLC